MAPVTITTYSADPVALFIGAGIFALTSSPANYRTGSFAYDNLLSRLPANWVSNMANYQRLAFWTLLILHTAEAAWLDVSRLQKHGIPRFSGLWWKWILGHLVVGFPNFGRFDALVKEKERAKAS